eukprot:scaffold66117_cov72-Phaeocystis_antarctica.AAC.2
MRANIAQFLLACSAHWMSTSSGVEVIADPAPLYISPLKYSAASASSMSSCDAYSSSGYSFFHNNEPSLALNLATIAEHTTSQLSQRLAKVANCVDVARGVDPGAADQVLACGKRGGVRAG